jgi:hypothetical protein
MFWLGQVFGFAAVAQSSSAETKDIAAIVSFNYLVFNALVQGRQGKLWPIVCDLRMC